MNIGIDVGSTTVKVVCYDNQQALLYKRYERHYSKVEETLLTILADAQQTLHFHDVKVTIAGSAGMDLAMRAGLTFTQEVVAATLAVEQFLPEVDAVIEIGGEDVKVIFFDNVIDQRMNSTCAGGTGAFIDQMATLLDVTPAELNELAHHYDKIYPIASRCGVFAKTDIQALINQGAKREDIAISIFQAVVNQTIAGLAQGRTFKGRVCFLGGPLTFFDMLRQRFQLTLKLSDDEVVFPQNAEYFIALGCALFARDEKTISYWQLIESLKKKDDIIHTHRLAPLFKNQAEKDQFLARHYQKDIETSSLKDYRGPLYIGIDAGSTTTKLVAIGSAQQIVYTHYSYNKGSVIEAVRKQLLHIYREKNTAAQIASCGVTGYGEALIKAAFQLDVGEVETIAHFQAAKHFMPEVDYIIDIGGQDMKCLSIKDGHIESIVLNEACSSGCGSFISSFASALGYAVEDFANMALDANAPVDLGSRCTIFMNSSVKQAQKEGASVADISAGLAISVVKNALYKVLRMTHASELGEHIVVQGGTFYNDAILRAFEKETDGHCVRPSIAGLMGAFGIALIAEQNASGGRSSLLAEQAIQALTFTSKQTRCQRCSNLCGLTVTNFSSGETFISGNRCELGLGAAYKRAKKDLFEYKLTTLTKINSAAHSQSIGMPFVLNNYENRPFWIAFFDELEIAVKMTPASDRHIYELGQHAIPSDTACYPAKMVHGHIEWLIDNGITRIFYPSIVYNFREKEFPKNNYNCPVVASYPEVIQNNNERVKQIVYSNPYLTLNDEKAFVKKMEKALQEIALPRHKRDIKAAYRKAIAAYHSYKKSIIDYGKQALQEAIESGENVLVLCGRPYHLDPEIHHGINDVISGLDAVVLSEDAVSHLADYNDPTVLNQWTYHTRLYDAAKYVANHPYPKIQLIQLVSFGCGLDAITSDEVSAIVESGGKIYTQIKIDEMSNLGAVKIRLRSLLATMRDKE